MTTQNKIKQSALELFSRKGYDGTSVGDIAKEVQIKTPSLYAHFKSKEEIFLVLVKELLSDYKEYMKEAIVRTKGQPLDKRLYDYFVNFVGYFSKDKTKSDFLIRILLFPPSDYTQIIGEEVTEIEQILIPLLIEVFTDEINVDINAQTYHAFVLAYFNFISGYVVGIFSISHELQSDRLEEIWSIFWNGFSYHIKKEL